MVRDLDFKHHHRRTEPITEPPVVKHIHTKPSMFPATQPAKTTPNQPMGKRSTFFNNFAVIIIFVLVTLGLIFGIYEANKEIAPNAEINSLK